MLALVLLIAQAASWQARFDELWKERDAPGIVKQLHALVDPAATDPRSFEANWRLAALDGWEANARDIEPDTKAAIARKAWDAADKAVAARPDDVRGHYYAAVGIGLYSEGVGIISALSQGLEGKFRERIQAALKLDKDYLDGAPQVVWGRYFFKLPWPKRDVGQATRILAEAVRTHPRNQRAKLYLADCYADSDHVDQGKELVRQILTARDAADGPEDRRVKESARNWLEAHGPQNGAY